MLVLFIGYLKGHNNHIIYGDIMTIYSFYFELVSALVSYFGLIGLTCW